MNPHSLSMITWGTIGLILLFLSYVASHYTSFHGLKKLSFTVLSPLLILLLLYIYVHNTQTNYCKVWITSPHTGIMVKDTVLKISGIVNPASARVTARVRSEHDTCWWVQEIVRAEKQEGNEGQWSLTAYIGTKETGVNENYEIIALASDDGNIFNLLTERYIYSGLTRPSVPLWYQSDLIQIRRVH